MRQTKFRAISKSTGDWVYGDLVHKRTEPDTVLIQDAQGVGHDADPQTVGQFTGMLDADGREIYEGDVIHSDNNSHTILFDDRYGAFRAFWGKNGEQSCFLYPDWITEFHKTVTGNIHQKTKKKNTQQNK